LYSTFTRNRIFRIHGNRKRQKISICGSVSILANFTQNIVKGFSIFDSLASKRCDGGKGQFTIKSKILPSKMFAIFSHLRHSHLQDSHQKITEIINGKSLNLGTAQ
jgi:hypothetical protein